MTSDEPPASDAQEVLFGVDRGLGWITLNRPKAINALNHSMVKLIGSQLAEWESDEEVSGVVIAGAGDRGLCAGGDVVSFYRDALSGGHGSVDFWRDEYELNERISSYPKTYIAVMDGIVMGGGVGISAHGSVRVVTDRTLMAMPEVAIGFTPDVGGTWLLARAPGETGTHLALTAARFGAADAIYAGLADRYVAAVDLPAVIESLDAERLDDVLTGAGSAPDSELEAQRHWIDECYGSDDVIEILERLRAHTEPLANQAAEEIARKSPVAVTVTLRALRGARAMTTLHEALEQELVISTAALRSHDLAEGIRAQVVDKDRTPHWSPAAFADVTPEMVDAYFR